ncbi:MAG: MotA/TolQ/ExbB proton channel family protein [Planctomycetota bacterium]
MNSSTLRKACIFLLVAIVVAYAFPAVFALAGDEAAPPPPPEAGAPGAGGSGGTAPAGFLAQMFSGGFIGISCTMMIVATSVVTLALAIEHMFLIKREILAPPELVATLESLMQEQDLEEAMTICQASDSFLAKCIEGALSKVNEGEEKMREAMESAAAEKVTKMRVKMGYINLMAVLAPFLGLYGTVIGMIMAFQMIAISGTPKPAELANGIQLALWTTAEGLTVAIPATALYYYFKNKFDVLLQEVGKLTEELLAGLLGGGGGEEEEAAEG